MPGDNLDSPLCPLGCSSGYIHVLSDWDRDGVVKGRLFHLVQCENCGLVHQHPRPTDEEIPGFYPKAYWWALDLGRTKDRVILGIRQLLWWDIMAWLERLVPQRGELLDAGCGSGIFLSVAHRAGFRVLGVEQSEETRTIIDRQFGLPVLTGGIETLDETTRFDVITMFHVLEHLANPLRVLRQLNSRLSEEGLLIVEVPDIKSWGFRLFGKRWRGLDLPRHITHFSLDTLTTLFDRAGFEPRAIRRFTFRNAPALLVFSLFPSLIQQTKESSRSSFVTNLARMAFQAVLFTIALPVTLLETAFGGGEVILVAVRKRKLAAKPGCLSPAFP